MNHIEKLLSQKDNIHGQDDVKNIVTKFNEFDIAMNFRLNLSMLLILTYMISGDVTGDKTVLLKGMDALIQNKQKLVDM
jgi:hypothetical protein